MPSYNSNDNVMLIMVILPSCNAYNYANKLKEESTNGESSASSSASVKGSPAQEDSSGEPPAKKGVATCQDCWRRRSRNGVKKASHM